MKIYSKRQSGKTTLLKSIFPDYDYILLEDKDNREYIFYVRTTLSSKYLIEGSREVLLALHSTAKSGLPSFITTKSASLPDLSLIYLSFM